MSLLTGMHEVDGAVEEQHVAVHALPRLPGAHADLSGGGAEKRGIVLALNITHFIVLLLIR